MEYLKYFDFFNVKFHFYIGGQPSHNSRFGGVMNILFVITCIITFLFLSLDDIRRLNPISSKSEIPGAEIRIVNFRDSKIWVPWRMVTYEEKFVDHRGILFPIVSLIEGHWNNAFGMDLKYHTLNYKLCNETSMANKTEEYKIDVPLNELFCIDYDDVPWGGSWLGDILYYIEVNLFLCKDGINFNASDPRCTKMTDLLKYRNTSWLFEFYYPVVQFQPTNINIPMAVIYRSYYYRLSTYANKVERIYIQENILSDDKNLFGSKYKNSSYWGVDNNIYGDTYFMPEGIDPLVKSTSSRLYSLVIYMDQGYIYYTRTYKKIFAIVSDAFPVLNLLLYLFKKITTGVKLTFAKKRSAEILFENIPKNQKNIISYKKKFFNEQFRNIKKESLNKINSYDNKKNNNNKNDEIKLNYNTNERNLNINDLLYHKTDLKKNCYKNSFSKELNNTGDKISSFLLLIKNENDVNKSNSKDINAIGILNKPQYHRRKSVFENRNYFPLDFSKFEEQNNSIKEKLKEKHKKDLFPLYYFFLDIFIDKLVKPKSFCYINKKYLIVYNFMGQIFDISSHILLFKHFNILKNLFLNELSDGKKDLIFFYNNKKININDDKLMTEVNKDLKTQTCDIFTKTLL